jgi:hypothetical protein
MTEKEQMIHVAGQSESIKFEPGVITKMGPTCPITESDKQKCKNLMQDLEDDIKDEIKAMGDYHRRITQLHELNFGASHEELVASIREDERKHRDMITNILARVKDICDCKN